MKTQEIISNQAQIIELYEKRIRIMAGVEKVENKGLEMLFILAQISSLKQVIKSGLRNLTNPD